MTSNSIADYEALFWGVGSAAKYEALKAAADAGITFLDLIEGAQRSSKDVVSYATAAALPTNVYNNGTLGVGATLTASSPAALSVDGQAVVAAQRLLVKNESTASHNGLYGVTVAGESRTVSDGVTASNTTIASATAAFVAGDVGKFVVGSSDLPAGAYITAVAGNGLSATINAACTGTHAAQTFTIGTKYVLTRSVDADEADELGPGLLIPVEGPAGALGTVNDQKIFISAAPSPFVVGTSSLTFALVGGTYAAGTGITLSGTTFSIDDSVVATDAQVATAVAAEATLRGNADTAEATARAAADALLVAKSLYDANTVLAATTDDTPAALTVPASTFVGRKSSGNVAAMSVSEAQTELGAAAASGLATLDSSSRVVQNPKVHGLGASDHSDLWLPSGVIAETFRRRGAGIASTGILTSQRLALALIEIPSTATVISTISFFGAANFSALVDQWFALYSYHATAPVKLAVTADDGSTAWSSGTAKTLYVSRSVTDAVATSGSAVITSATAAFSANDVGKRVTFMGAGAAGVPLGTSASAVTIASVQSATQATLSTTASTSVASNGTLYIATPYTLSSTGLYYLGILVNGTVANLHCSGQGAGSISGLAPITSQGANTGLTVATGAPDPASNLANLSAAPYAQVA